MARMESVLLKSFCRQRAERAKRKEKDHVRRDKVPSQEIPSVDSLID